MNNGARILYIEDDPGLSRLVRANVGKIQVQRHEDSILRSTPGCDYLIIRPRQVLIGNRVRNESGVA